MWQSNPVPFNLEAWISFASRTLGLIAGLAITLLAVYPFLEIPNYLPAYLQLVTNIDMQPAVPADLISPRQFSQQLSDK